MKTERELLALKEQIAEAKNHIAELKGQQTALMRQLKEEWGCTSIEEAEVKLTELKDNIAALDEQIREMSDELDKKYPI